MNDDPTSFNHDMYLAGLTGDGEEHLIADAAEALAERS
ncbi:hypothetical protein ACP70R_048882 [Stipagrostis hirtigluma subsp. patula]